MGWINASYKQTWVVRDNEFKNTEKCKFDSVQHPQMIHVGSWASLQLKHCKWSNTSPDIK